MLNDAARYYKQNGTCEFCVLYLSHILAGDVYAARYYLSNTILFDGLEPPLDADFSLSYSKGSLAEWKKRLFIGERGEDWENQVRLSD